MSDEKANKRSLSKADDAIGSKDCHLLDDALKRLDTLRDKDGDALRNEIEQLRKSLTALHDAMADAASPCSAEEPENIEQVSRELDFTNRIITEAGRLTSVDEICQFISKEIHSVNPQCFVTVSMVDPPKKTMTVKAVEGPPGIFEKALSFLGLDPVGMELKFDPEKDREEIFERGKLCPLPGGFYTLMARTLPKVFTDYLERIFNIESIYCVEFSVEDQMYGGLSIIKPNGVKLKYKPSIETIATHMGAVFQRNQAVNALRESEDRYRTLFETAPFGIVRTTGQGLPLVWNKRMVNILGFDEIKDANGYYADLGKQMYADPSHRDEFIQELRKHGEVKDFEYEAIHRKGHHIWLRMDAKISGMTKDGGYIIDAYVNDVTELRRAELRLHEENEVNRLIASLTRVLLTPVSLDEISRLVHDYAMNITGSEYVFVGYCEDGKRVRAANFNGDFWMAEREKDVVPYHELPGALGWTISEQSSLIANDIVNDDRLAGWDGVVGTVSKVVSAPAMKGSNFIGLLAAAGNGEPYHEWDKENLERLASIYAVALERKQDEIIINSALMEAERADLLKTTLLQNMSHEIRTPINGIMGFADILSEYSEEDDPQQNFVRKIKKSASRLLSTLNSVITYASLSSSGNQPAMTARPLNRQLEKIAAAYREKAIGKGLEFNLYLPEEEVIVNSEDSLLASCFGALLENAVKFTSEGEVSLTLTKTEEAGTAFAEALVTDTGIGITAAQKETVFDAFRQASEGLGRAYEGTGLGLAIAKKIVDLHHGQLSLSSDGKSGTTFRVLLPLAGSKEKVERGRLSDGSATTSKLGANGDKLKVLVVEDNEINLELIELYLSGLAQITKAETGIGAVKAAQQSVFDLVLMDINLGAGLDGIETMRKIQKETPNKTVPFVATTGYAGPGDKKMLLKQGFTEYLPKPFTRQDLQNCLQKLQGK